MIRNVTTGRNRKIRSLALETFWSRGAICWGDKLAVRYLFRPAPNAPHAPDPSETDPGYLSIELARRLEVGDISYELCLQLFADPNKTPIEDTSIEWTRICLASDQGGSPQDQQTEDWRRRSDRQCPPCRRTGFNPWNTTEAFRPLGNLNRARKVVYDASAAYRHSFRWTSPVPFRNQLAGNITRRAFLVINRYIAWHRLPLRLSLLNLDAFRYVLREKNLIGTDPVEAPPVARPTPPPAIAEGERQMRTYDGTFNDLSAPKMGAVGSTFGRNLTPVFVPELFDTPNPVVVAQQLLHRDTFIPARSLNILAAAWIQFQVHDWVNHARHPLGKRTWSLTFPPA